MDFAGLRRRLAFRSTDGTGEYLAEEVLTTGEFGRAVEDGRVEEDRMMLPQIEDQGRSRDAMSGPPTASPGRERMAMTRGSSARRSHSKRVKAIEDSGERFGSLKGEREPSDEVVTTTPQRFSMATPDPERARVQVLIGMRRL